MKQADYAVITLYDGTRYLIWVWGGEIKTQMLMSEETILIEDDYVELRDIAKPKRVLDENSGGL